MKATHLPSYLVGRRDAILEIATTPGALIVSGLLVISAGLAREYDGEDLIHQPWHVLRPLGASVASSLVLFALLYGAARLKAGPALVGFWSAYRAFLPLFWMTAPLAWLYAVPYERFLSPVGAVHANMYTLAVVAGWRVLLITRAASVLFGTGFIPMLFLVMLYADALVFAVATLVPAPVFNIMAGVRPDDPDSVLANAVFSTTVLSVFTAPLWLLGAMISAAVLKPAWAVAAPGPPSADKGLMRLAIASLLVWGAILPFTQPEQWRRHKVERLLTSGHVAQGLAEMSRRSPAEFPPHWDPPPRPSYRQNTPDLKAVRQIVEQEGVAPWVADVFAAKVGRQVLAVATPFGPATWAHAARFAADNPEIAGRFAPHIDEIEFVLRHQASLSPEEHQSAARILEAARASPATSPAQSPHPGLG